MKRLGATGFLAAGWLSAGCGGGGGLGQPVAAFPSRSELESVMGASAKPVSTLKTVDVDSWRIETPVPAPGAGYPSENVWDQMVVRLVARSSGKLSGELRCAAQETARFFIANGAFPDDGTRRYFGERCGSTLTSFSLGTLTGDAPAGVSDAQIAGQYEKSLMESLEAAGVDGGAEVGVGVARGGGKIGVTIVSGRRVAALKGFSPLVAGNSVTLQGVLSKDTAFALGVVNQGSFGVLTCEPDRTVNLPSFRMSCPVAPDDAQTLIEISTRKPGRVLMDVELQALVRRTEDAGLTYEPVTRGSNAVAQDVPAFQTALLSELNEVRRSAGAPQLSLEDRQSTVNGRLAPHLFVASTEGSEDMVDQIGLGALAGWEVQGLIRDGGVYWGFVTSTRSPGRFLTYALESPFARFILLDPSMTRVAIGAAGLEPSGAMALMTTYSFFQSQDHGADEDRLFQELSKRRVARRHSAPRRAPRERVLSQALARIAAGTETTDQALDSALHGISESQRRSVWGWVTETTDLRQISWPDALVDNEPLEVEIGITHYKAPGGAWGQYAVVMIVYGAGASNTAQAGTVTRF